MKPIIHLALTDDWELRGNGSGDPGQIQFRPMRELLGLYRRYGVRATFNAEVMQQLTFRKYERQFPELKALADRWDEHVRAAVAAGHDVQLHVHPQWSEARYDGGRWHLGGDWSILNYSPAEARAMLVEGKEYLENLLRPVAPGYAVVSFRAGALAIAPSPFMLATLAELGIVFDTSIAAGMRVNTRHLQLDYTNCEEDFLPFYPHTEDARRVSDKMESIACVPIFQFRSSGRRAFVQLLSKVQARARRKLRPRAAATSGNTDAGDNESYAQQEWAEVTTAPLLSRLYEKAVKPCLQGRHMVSDLGALDAASLREMLARIRQRARESGLAEVPVVLTNHSKYISDFTAIDGFLAEASGADDIRFLTLSELAARLRAGEFPIRKAGEGRA